MNPQHAYFSGFFYCEISLKNFIMNFIMTFIMNFFFKEMIDYCMLAIKYRFCENQKNQNKKRYFVLIMF